MRKSCHEEYRRSPRLQSQIYSEFRSAIFTVALDVAGNRTDELGILFPSRYSLISTSEFCGASQCLELCCGSLWSKSFLG